MQIEIAGQRLAAGTRIHYSGDYSNESAFGRIVAVESASWVQIKLDGSDRPQMVPAALFSEIPGRRFRVVAEEGEAEKLEGLLAEAEKASKRAAAARAALPAGTSRARVTTANARWMRAAEYRDLLASKLAGVRA